MTFWQVFWTANELLWPVYVSLIALYLVSMTIIWWTDRKSDETHS